MFNHWDRNLNVKEMVVRLKPKLIVELGAGGGNNTDQYLELAKTQPFELISISDGNCPMRYKDKPNYKWIKGISYLELPKFEDNSIDFCTLDTDHNYWTLQEELSLLASKMKRGGVVVIHDTESYGHSSGVMDAYECEAPYPSAIRETSNRPMTDALNEWVGRGVYKIIKEVKESCGATAIEKL